MGYDYDCGSGSAACVLKYLKDLLTGVVVKSSRRFVAEKKLRVLGKRTGYGNTLLLTAGSL